MCADCDSSSPLLRKTGLQMGRPNCLRWFWEWKRFPDLLITAHWAHAILNYVSGEIHPMLNESGQPGIRLWVWIYGPPDICRLTCIALPENEVVVCAIGSNCSHAIANLSVHGCESSVLTYDSCPGNEVHPEYICGTNDRVISQSLTVLQVHALRLPSS